MVAPYLPEPLIHRIQSFLTAKKAAETAAISKSWLHAWLTRPTIDLDCSLFTIGYPYNYPQIDKLSAFATETFRRYEDLDLTINAFSLRLTSPSHSLSDLAADLTKRALKLGASDFTFRSAHGLDISLPIRLVLRSDNPIRILRLERVASLDRLLEESIECRGLKSLSLSSVKFSIDSLFRLISCFPLIEHLSLAADVLGDEQGVPSIPIRLLHLTSLNLHGFRPNHLLNLFRDNALSLSQFPNLKELTLYLIFVQHDTTEMIIPSISSGSLEIFNLTIEGYREYPRVELEIDAPRIRKLAFDSCVVPRFTLRSSKSRDGLECSVLVRSGGALCASWLCELREFLSSMAGSKIRLCLKLSYSFEYLPGDIECLSVCELEDLTMEAVGFPSMSFYAVLDVLFRMCHPKTVTQYLSPPEDDYMFDDEDLETIRKNDVILCRVLEQGMKGKLEEINAEKLCDDQVFWKLEEINAEKLCDDQVFWMPQPLDSVLESITSQDQRSRFRFNLKWKPSVAT